MIEEGDYDKYCSLTPEERIKKILGIEELLEEKHQNIDKKAELLNEKGKILTAGEEYEVALIAFDKAIEIKPDFRKAWNNRGYALGQLGRLEQAIESYDKAIEIKPDFHQAWYNKASYYALQNNIDKAVENLQQAINLNPEKYR